MGKMQVKVADHGFSEEYKKFYVTYQVTDLDTEDLLKLKERIEDPVVVRCNDLYLTTYFEEVYYPFESEEAQRNPEDFIAREELEMTAYLLGLLED